MSKHHNDPADGIVVQPKKPIEVVEKTKVIVTLRVLIAFAVCSFGFGVWLTAKLDKIDADIQTNRHETADARINCVDKDQANRWLLTEQELNQSAFPDFKWAQIPAKMASVERTNNYALK